MAGADSALGFTLECPAVMNQPLSTRRWPARISLGLLWLAARLPYRWQLRLGRGLGRVMLRLSKRRREIARTNFGLCFPELDDAGRNALLREHFESLGMGIMEMALSWWGSDARLKGLVRYEGMEHLERAQEAGRGVLVVAAHFTTLEIGARLLALAVPIHPMYRPHNDPLFEHVQGRSRSRHSAGAIPRHEIRTIVRTLKRNACVWYAPDQDFGNRQSVFVPFFGIPAATLTASSRLARMSGAKVVPMTQQRLPGGAGYRVVLEPALEGFPSGDESADATRLNAVFERWVRDNPADYLWVHRRFKTRPAGLPSIYE